VKKNVAEYETSTERDLNRLYLLRELKKRHTIKYELLAILIEMLLLGHTVRFRANQQQNMATGGV